MKKLLILFILLVPFVAPAKDIFHRRLDGLYASDKKKCLEVSKRYMKWFPDKAISYYYASVIYQEKSTKSRSIQGSYRNLRQAIGYAMKFEEKDQDMLREELEWKMYKTKVSQQASELVEKLNAADEAKMSNSLLDRLETFDKTFVIQDNLASLEAEEAEMEELPEQDEFEEIPIEAHVPTTEEYNKPAEFERIEGHFYGMPTGKEDIKSSDLGAELKVISLINAERRKLGMEPLEWDKDLTRACRYHSYDMATQNYFNHDVHDRRNGELVKVGETFKRIRLFYDASSPNTENIAAGNIDPEATYKQWYDSKGHYDNMFDPDSKRVGIGVYFDENSPFGYYWTFCTAL